MAIENLLLVECDHCHRRIQVSDLYQVQVRNWHTYTVVSDTERLCTITLCSTADYQGQLARMIEAQLPDELRKASEPAALTAARVAIAEVGR